MTNKGLAYALQKHIKREVLESAEFAVLMARVQFLSEYSLVKYLLSPLCAHVKTAVKSAVGVGSVSIRALDAASEGVLAGGEFLIDGAVNASFGRAEDLVHGLFLGLGRCFWRGRPYEREFSPKKSLEKLRHALDSRESAQEFVVSALEGARYDDLLQEYAPYTWQTLREGYSRGVLLDVEGVSQEGGRVEFDAYFYDEPNDAIRKKHSAWQIKSTDEKGQRPTIYKAEISDVE
ncbi:uncharacterized protein NEMAJ01_0227 [Nematocida major]|uniref:uncharacterized protein n=1 Tax=Nematocida major TaxID=1912982 RepID=UPI0020072178|nr:uncharacterized protein NEMAJ01_0227 [Nematocida major]KAH9385331.1 hypothetical protein NEMAJ01_0227 [Nematocida major]